MDILADNYLPRATGAVYVKINKSKLFFHSGQIVGVVIDRVLYRDEKLQGGTAYRRVRDVVARSEANTTRLVTTSELKELATTVIMHAASTEFDKKYEGNQK